MSVEDIEVKRIEPTAELSRTASEALVSCGNCGKDIQKHQKRIDVLNTRYKGYEHYHEDYRGCYESTRISKKRVVLSRFKPWLSTWIDDNYESQSKHWDN